MRFAFCPLADALLGVVNIELFLVVLYAVSFHSVSVRPPSLPCRLSAVTKVLPVMICVNLFLRLLPPSPFPVPLPSLPTGWLMPSRV
jgi:hypothetical protein